MMTWGRKKTNTSQSSSLSSRPSSISRVLPVSWLSKFKNTKGSSEPEVAKANTNRRAKKNSASPSEPRRTCSNEGRFCNGNYDDDESYWRLSFDKERFEGGMEAQRRRRRRRRTKQGRNVKACSPRTVECKIKALEDIKRARMKLKERETKDTICFDSFAIVKSSFDPQKDFRDSMIEMIIEKNMTRTEELEELLACYLTLNCDEYHDLIVKVFRQVWFELNQLCFDLDL